MTTTNTAARTIKLPARPARDELGRITNWAADHRWQVKTRKMLADALGWPHDCVATCGEMRQDLRAQGFELVEG